MRPNFSLGVHLFFKILEKSAKLMKIRIEIMRSAESSFTIAKKKMPLREPDLKWRGAWNNAQSSASDFFGQGWIDPRKTFGSL